MKKIIGLVILFGFVLMLGAAGSADFSGMSFVNVLLLELLGMVIVLFGTSALMHYKRYVRKMMLKKRAMYIRSAKNHALITRKIRVPEKEMC